MASSVVEPIVVAGCGALGSIYAGLLAASGVDVVVLANGRHEEALRREELELRLPDRTERVRVRAADSTAAGTLILTARLFDTQAVLDRVEGRPGLAVSLQNGVAKNEPLIDRFGGPVVARAVSMVAAEMIGPGIAQSVALAPTYLEPDPRCDGLAEALAAAGLPVDRVDGVSAEWSKLAMVAAIMSVQAVTRRFLHELMLDDDAALLFRLICREVAAVAAVHGVELVDLAGGLPVRTIAAGDEAAVVSLLHGQGERLVAAGATSRRTSLLRAAEEGRRTELDGIVGELVGRGAAAGVALPTLEATWRLARLTGVKT